MSAETPRWEDAFYPRHVQHRQALTRGLVGEHEDLYKNSPSFKAAIDGLAGLLPMMVLGIVSTSRDLDAAHLARVETLKRPMPPLPPEFFTERFGSRSLRDSDGFPIPTHDPIDMAREAQGEQL